MQFVLRSAGVSWELARRLGPYLMLEILLPGGTLLALLLFLYRRRTVGWRDRRAAQHARQLGQRSALSHRDFRNSMIAC